MVDFSTLLVFSVAALTLVLGPNHVYIVTRGIGQGRRAAVASVFGVETATLLHAAAAGMSAILASSALAFSVVKYLGVAYLIYLGVRTLLGKGEEPALEAHGGTERLGRVYLQGALAST